MQGVKNEDICIYFEGFATKQMHKANCKLHPNLGVYLMPWKWKTISLLSTYKLNLTAMVNEHVQLSI